MMENKKKLVLVSTIIRGVRRSLFIMTEFSDGEKVLVPSKNLPGVAKLAPGERFGVGY